MRSERSVLQKRSARTGVRLIILWLIGYLCFRCYPFLSSFIFSFTDFNLFGEAPQFVGFDNYLTVFRDEKMTAALLRSFAYAGFTVPLKLLAALGVACLLCTKCRGIRMFRTIYYIPSLLGSSPAIAILWKSFFRTDGPLNALLSLFGIQAVNWLGDPAYALFVVGLLRVWQFGSAMLLFLGALQGVPHDITEAAALDGAGSFRRFFSITLPMISPVLFYNLITQLAQTFQEFNAPFIITQGGPRSSTTLFSLLIYNEAFQHYEMGQASAMAWILFLIVASISALAFLSQNAWVYYNDGR